MPGTATLLASGGYTSFERPAHPPALGVSGADHGGGHPGLASSGTSNFFASARSASKTGYARSCVESLMPPDMNPAAIDVPIATYSLKSFFVSCSPGALARFAGSRSIGPVGTLLSAHPANGIDNRDNRGRSNARRDTDTSGHIDIWLDRSASMRGLEPAGKRPAS